MDRQFLIDWSSDVLINQVWKLFPFQAGNRWWIVVLLKAYGCCLAICVLLACVLNAAEGQKWLESNHHGHGVIAKGNTALDECIWFVFTTMHGIGFGEFMARGVTGRIITMICISLGYWFTIFMMSIIMLSSLPGEKTPSLYRTTMKMVSAVWPSYACFICCTCMAGCIVSQGISKDKDGRNEWPTGIYWVWTVVHRMPFGDMWPDTVLGRHVTVPAAIFGLAYMPYALALLAVRAPNAEQHRRMLDNIRDRPEEALGRGYMVPQGAGAGLREFVMQEYVPEPPSA